MPNDFKQKTVERKESVELKGIERLPDPVLEECFTGWDMYVMYLVVVGIIRNEKRRQYFEILYKERGNDINKDEDLERNIIKYFDIGAKDVFEINHFHRIKNLGNGAKD